MNTALVTDPDPIQNPPSDRGHKTKTVRVAVLLSGDHFHSPMILQQRSQLAFQAGFNWLKS